MTKQIFRRRSPAHEEEQEERLVSKRPPRHLLRYWTWEVAAVVVAFALLATIASVLAHHQDRELPNLPYRINLNTLIAILGTIMRALLFLPLAEVIGQTKWTWFRGNDPRTLRHLETHDEASRGFWGALKLVAALRGGLRGNLLGVCASLGIILSLGIGPFSQQAFTTYACRRLESGSNVSATLPIGFRVPGRSVPTYAGFSSRPEMPNNLSWTIMAALVNPGATIKSLGFDCSTGDCEFHQPYDVPFSTIGLCSECIETTSLVNKTSRRSNLELEGLKVATHNTNGNFMSLGSSNGSFAQSRMTESFRRASSQALANISVLTTSATIGDEDDYVSSLCSIYTCVKDLEAHVENGRLYERVIETHVANITWNISVPKSDEDWWNLKSAPDVALPKYPCVKDGKLLDLDDFSEPAPNAFGPYNKTFDLEGTSYTFPAECYFYGKANYLFGLGSKLAGVLDGGCLYRDPGIWCDDRTWLSGFAKEGHLTTYADIETVFDNLVTALTNFFREDSQEWWKEGDDRLLQCVIPGEAWISTTCVRFEWEWLVFPAVLCILTLVVLVSAVVASYLDQRQPVWKTSILPLLYIEIEEPHTDDTRKLGIDDDHCEMTALEKTSDSLQARLIPSDTTEQLSLVCWDASVPQEEGHELISRNSENTLRTTPR